MARRVKEVTITREGRDKGKTFVLTEVPAEQGERWAAKMIFLLQQAGVDIPTGTEPGDGLAGLAIAGAKAVMEKLRFEDVAPLWDEMFTCVQYKPDDLKAPLQGIMPGSVSQIEEISTRLELRKELLFLHIGFSTAGR